MRKKLLRALRAQSLLLTYLAGALTVSAGAALIFLPAGVIAAGVFLIALVVETGGRP